jgi:GNAT superfamily N-acetyltransferase
VTSVSLCDEDVESAFTLSSIAGWNQRHDDWRTLLNLPGACYGIRIDGRIVSTATLVSYGTTLGWIGMVLTHPDFRRQGLARALFSKVMEHARLLGIRTLKLDATAYGRPLYESFGFRAEQTVERWQRLRQPENAVTLPASTAGVPDLKLDADACGYDRGELLARLSACGDCASESDGFALSRPGRIHRYLGPCVAANASNARSVIETTLTRHPDTGWFWDLLPANPQATELARELGFECVRKLTRMSWGPELRGEEHHVFAIAGLEHG